VSLGFYVIDNLERRFSNKPIAAEFDAGEQEALNSGSEMIHKGANTLRLRQGLEAVSRFGGEESEGNGLPS
jgi:hypothetical protein